MGPSQFPPFPDAVDWEDSLEKTPAAVSVATQAWADVRVWLILNAKHHLLTIDTVVAWHQQLFEGVFPQFAGKLRNENFPWEVHFGHEGKHLGIGFRFVDSELAKYERNLHYVIDQLDSYPRIPKEDFDLQVVRGAAWSHAEFVRIHPFLNGNGRIGRMIINYFAERYGLEALGPGRPSETAYISAMDTYMVHRDPDTLISFLMPLMVPISPKSC